ncbi:helix-turn-helix domain-containing protein [Larkinella soli]|uniref:helix-turn-helix domain-containing protein n=1 Tax=Larkinella soli TaxID=1770527 RepID=UPI000FFBD3C6|nr:helix-turn-helix domain-containing protein [Larkinella soli]
MPHSLKNYEGLYGDTRYPRSEGFMTHELLEVRSRQYEWFIDEHLHTNLVQLFFFTSGNGVVLSENRRIALDPPCVLLISSNTLHGFSFDPGMVGEVLTIQEEVLEAVFRSSPHILLELNGLKHFPFPAAGDAFRDLVDLKERLCRELPGHAPEKETSLQLLLQLLWIQIYRVSLASEVQIQHSDNRTLRYFQSFQKMIRQSLHEVRSVQEYARELNITTVHLNRICQGLVRKSASQIIHDYLTAEAKKYLLHTTFTLSEISYQLNLKDPAYFSRFFKKQTGLSPGAFRKQARAETGPPEPVS